MPFLPPREYRQIQDRVDIVLMPSTTEGFGLPVLEGLVRYQVPVISFDPALVEVADGRAILADASDPSTFALLRDQGSHPTHPNGARTHRRSGCLRSIADLAADMAGDGRPRVWG